MFTTIFNEEYSFLFNPVHMLNSLLGLKTKNNIYKHVFLIKRSDCEHAEEEVFYQHIKVSIKNKLKNKF